MNVLTARENNSMSLSCVGKICYEDSGIIRSVEFSGMPRTKGDGWTRYFKDAKVGHFLSISVINAVLSYNGKNNVVVKRIKSNG